ncbi:MliC family protein [Sandaracinobacter sp. RS1-74]|uniref:MliC family protein n=1 Tax=Sandaracinobacteroides sayramensis TaxID=2913411 RepID=UPI001EDC0CD0|nr:MliC family protein [Sandaracinobacteroides sayramensis]MCG2842841.1 MliC family protein [Sandaracinobacteroides sayramensis]
MKITLLGGLAAAALLAACNKPAETPAEAPAVETPDMEVPASDVPDIAVPEAGVVGADLPADHSTAAQKAEVEKAAADAGVPPTKQSRTGFACDNGETIEVRFFPDQGIAVLVRGGQNVELNGEPVASGFHYTNGQTAIRGKGDELELTVGMMAPTKCKAKAA